MYLYRSDSVQIQVFQFCVGNDHLQIEQRSATRRKRNQNDSREMMALPPPSLQRLSTFKNPPPSSQPSSSSSPLDSFANDPTLAPFLSPSFSSSSFSSAALASGSPASTAERLHQAIRLLDSQLRSDVVSRHPELLSQLSSLSHAEISLSSLRSSVSSLQSSIRRIRSDLSDPVRSIRSKSVQLSNLHSAAELLSHSVRALRLSKKLRDLTDGSDPEKIDLTKSAQLHFEILAMCKEYDLFGIDVVDEEIEFVKEIGERLRSEAMKVLERGVEGLNQAEVGTGLQVFYNLGELKGTVDQLVNKYRGVAVKSVSVAMDMKAVSSGFGPGGIRSSGALHIGGGGKVREALWQRMGSCMDQLYSLVVAVWHLQRVLSKKRDPFTHVLLLDEVIKEGDSMLTDRVWDALVKAFTSQMKSAFTASSFVKEIFTMGYPKLVSMIENLLERISRDTDVKGVLPAVDSERKEQMVSCIAIFQTAFLSLCFGRLSDLVNSIFPMSSRGNLPSKEQISQVLSHIQDEIEAVHPDGRLTLLVLREIGKALSNLAQRAECQISTGPETRQITGPATSTQIRNFTLSQHLQGIHTYISSMVADLPSIAADVLSPHLGAIYAAACEPVTPLFKAMRDQLESCILQIHDQNFGVDDAAALDNNSSPYMEELQRSILHFRKEFLSRLLPSAATANAAGTESICTRLARQMASRVLIFYIRHASLVRPLSEWGKLRMARDMAELELAVGQNLFPVEQLGAPYRALRAFRPLVFLETSEMGSSPLIQDLPPSIVLHHLYTRGPDELESPMQKNRLSPKQYSLWLDSQKEDQIWKGVKATLDDYAVKIRSRGEKEFSPVYPLMLQIGSSLTQDNV
ncbi:PREDICTED: conserved oligomeric Golgi complex subunit 5-like isoform X1 [Brassica oleracea var. oleracea]|uniref:Conserved oligomeric Golgi complex subunit 5 n=2 Tax=Brassica oleracea var. oleracea TaxID=109376 RepID=A0A0D3CXY6_BRAOL|nr:PREDICTED: conserved oligomeric Golgi complex subunit 5-like isoform X1 [Brassica oleracea var. oleracea]